MMTKEEAITKAFALAREAGLNPDELTDMDNRSRWVYEWEMGLLQARNDGLAAGREEGREEGVEEGARRLLLRLIKKRFDSPPSDWEDRIAMLPFSGVEVLSDFIMDAPEVEELETQLKVLEEQLNLD